MRMCMDVREWHGHNMVDGPRTGKKTAGVFWLEVRVKSGAGGCLGNACVWEHKRM